MSWPARSTRSWRDGWPTTGGSTAPSCPRCWRASTPTWCAGSATSTDGWTAPGPPTPDLPSWPPASLGCSGTGPGSPPPGDEDDKSPVTGDCHAGICGSRGLQCPRLPDPGPPPAAGLTHLTVPTTPG